MKFKLKNGTIILIDKQDLNLVSKYSWHLNAQNYVISEIYYNKCKNKYSIYMHRLIMDCPDDLIIDHINHNTLDNRKCNLRFATRITNAQNSKKQRKECSSKYKGVYFDKSRNKYRAYITFNKKRIELGRFKTELEAAETYNQAALKYFGEFARLNNIL